MELGYPSQVYFYLVIYFPSSLTPLQVSVTDFRSGVVCKGPSEIDNQKVTKLEGTLIKKRCGEA